RKLPAGTILTVKPGQTWVTPKPYWTAKAMIEQAEPFAGSEAEAAEQLDALLRDAVGLRMIADVPLGAFLSGGIDSSTVVALMQAQSSRPVKTFTIGFHEDDYNEAAHAKRIAQHLGTEHTELYLTAQDALNIVPLLPAMFDEPFADSSQIPTHLVSKLARGSVTVSLSGDGGDELFGGYQRYFLVRSLWNSVRQVPRPLRQMAAGLIHSLPPGGIDRTYRLVRGLAPKRKRLSAVGEKAHKLAGFLGSQSPESIYMQALSHWTPSQVVRNSNEPDTISRFIADSSWLPSLEERMMLTDLVNYLPDDILTKVDRASMAVSLEARVPILDHRVVEF